MFRFFLLYFRERRDKKIREFLDQFSHFRHFIIGISSTDISIAILISFRNLFWTECKPKYAINTFTIIISLSERTRPRWKKNLFHTLTPWWHLKFEYVYRSDDDDALTAFFAFKCVSMNLLVSPNEMCNRIQIRISIPHRAASQSVNFIHGNRFVCDNIQAPFACVTTERETVIVDSFISFMPPQTVFASSLSCIAELRCRVWLAFETIHDAATNVIRTVSFVHCRIWPIEDRRQ